MSFPVLLGIGIAAAVLPVLLLLSLVQIAELSARTRELEALRSENESYREQGRRVRELEAELAELQEFETRLRRWAGIEVSDDAAPAREERGQHRWEQESALLAEIPSLMPVTGWVSRGFERGPEGHAGIDLVGETGTPVRSAALGVVRFAGWNDTFGNLVILDHGNGYTSFYGHNDTLLVETGSLVPRGQTIARLGNTGQSSAPHLHFEVRLEEEPLDPALLLTPAG